MAYEITGSRRHPFLFPPCIDDWIPGDHPARFIDDLVESLNLEEYQIHSPVPGRGRPRYSPKLLLKIIIFCYFHRVHSFREMERVCCENIAAVWLAGGERPDHNTFWRFWKNNGTALRSLLKTSVRIALHHNLVSLAVHAVDGTKIKARATLSNAHHRASLEADLSRMEKSIDEMEKALEASREEPDYRLPEELQKAEERKRAIEESLKELKQQGTTHLSPAEPEARVMKTREGSQFAYNAQAVAEERTGLVVAGDVVTDQNDVGTLSTMTAEAEENVGQPPEVTVADKGYWSPEEIEKAEQQGHHVLVATPKHVLPNKGEGASFHPSQFEYDPESDRVKCPLGQWLTFQRVGRGRRSGQVRVYVCRHSQVCPHRGECCGKRGRRREIKLGQHHMAVQRHLKRVQEPKARKKLRRRKVIIEPVFGAIKENLKLRRWSFRSLEGVRTQWAVVCTAYNLRKLFAYWEAGMLQLA